jgi:hypothetical protein
VTGRATEKPLASDPPLPLGLVTVTSRGPVLAAASIANVAVSRVADTKATLLTVMPVPALTVAPLTNPLPSIVTGTLVPRVPWFGDTVLTTTPAVAVVTACADVPSENVAVTVSVRPAAKP